MGNTGQKFGGGHTEEKLNRVAKYLNAFTTALKKQRFRLLYIDAFAGTGYREPSVDAKDIVQEDMFAGAVPADSENMKSLMKGSAGWRWRSIRHSMNIILLKQTALVGVRLKDWLQSFPISPIG